MTDLIQAGTDDAESILGMMEKFYSSEHIEFDRSIAEKALLQLLWNESLGQVYLISSDNVTAGYMVITYGFSLEFRGKFALLDELYIKTEFRGKGLGSSALRFAEESCIKNGISAIRLEAARVNVRAQKLYRSMDYTDHNRDLLTKWLIS